jgi:ribonuclease H / adenosylcobalamin/alpha-ribazole phosphatase
LTSPTSRRSVVVEADGGSRGNPGPAAYGALLKDAETGEVIAERGETIGTATNNVAEYRGLIAGLELAAEHAPEAEVEVRMDSKLVVEQMSGNWKIKHPSMKPLAVEANRLAPKGTTYTWVPRAENVHADRLANEALDGLRDASGPTGETAEDAPVVEERAPALRRAASDSERSVGTSDSTPPAEKPDRGWGPPRGKPTTLILVRHGVTDATKGKLFSGGLASSNPPLNQEGREQARATGEWLAPLSGTFDALVSSPVRRTRQTAEILAEFFDLAIEEEHAVAEMEFGTWDGMSFTEVHEKWPDELGSWLGDLESAPHGGESFRAVEKRVLEGRDRILESYAGQTVVVVSHVTPIKTLIADALGAPLDAVYRMELAPASVSVVSYFNGGPDGDIPMANMRLYNARPTEIFG